jgi:hypothetical protein
MFLAALILSGSRQPAQITIDATRTAPISPYIYGANFPDWKKIHVPFTFARFGGNRTTAYNWETNASNAGNDYHHQNDDYMDPTNEPGRPYRLFLESAQAHGAAVLLTIPTAGHVAADKKGNGDVNQTPDYIHTRFLPSAARKGSKFVYPPDTYDKVVYEDEFVAWLEKIKSPKTPLWFSLDNEPDIWQSTHVRIVPKNVGYEGILANNIEYASAIKAVAPKALVFGPANYGWQGFRKFQDATDSNGRDFLDFYLSSMKRAEARHHRRLLDVLDIHWYPEARGGDVRITDNSPKPETAQARIQAPRSLWDPTYVETSWITQSLGNKPIALLPRVKGQIRANYPGTRFAITEYNYGGGNDISGAIAQADVLGIFGRYGLFAASNWGIGPKDAAELVAFSSFLNFDGKGSRFGDLSAAVTGVDPATTSIYAATDSHDRRRLTIVAINKAGQASSASIGLRGFAAKGQPRAFVVTARNLDRPVARKGGSLNGNSLQIELAPESVTTIELRR